MALLIPVLRAWDELQEIVALAVVAFLQRVVAWMAHAHGWLRVSAAQGHPLSFPQVINATAEVLVAHFASFGRYPSTSGPEYGHNKYLTVL